MKTRNRWKDEMKVFEYLPKEFQKSNTKDEKIDIMSDLQKISCNITDQYKDGEQKINGVNEEVKVTINHKHNFKKNNEKGGIVTLN